MYTAKEAVEVYVAGSEKRAKNSALKIFVLAIFAGMFIGFGAAGSSLAVHNIDNVGVARLVAGVVFPVGLMMVLLTGAELFTGNCLFIMGTVEKKFSVVLSQKARLTTHLFLFERLLTILCDLMQSQRLLHITTLAVLHSHQKTILTPQQT